MHGGQGALASFELRANGPARFSKLVEEVQPERPERDIRLLGKVDCGALRIEHAHAGYELILTAPIPFPRFGFGSDLLLY